MNDNQIPYEDCTKDEAVAYLEKHIDGLNSTIATLEGIYTDAKEQFNARSWCLDRAVRLHERSGKDASKVIEEAKLFYAYIKITKEAE